MIKNIDMVSRWFLMIILCVSSIFLHGQDVLLVENFDDCTLPSDWVLEVTNDQDAGATFGYMYNDNSDSLTIDGSCMVIFDDDLLGNNMPSFKAELRSPMLNVADYSSINFSVDVAFRSYGSSSLELFVIANGEYTSIARYSEDNGTGSSFSQAINFRSDLSFLVDTEELQIAIVYDDNDMYAWYGGVDNDIVTGEDKGEAVVLENFNNCELPDGWESEIIRGQEAWVFGVVENDNASANSMNGSCFAYFDDDGIGQDVPFSTVELRTPIFDGSAFAEYVIDFDLIFRKAVDFENISVYVFDGSNYYLVEEFIEEVGGEQFNVFESLSLDLTPYRASQMQVAFRYEDGDSWGWWAGIDNVKISGKGDINDICTKAEPLVVNQQCVSVSNRVAVSTGPTASCAESIKHTLWYKFTADRSGFLEITNQADYNDVISIFSGSCDDLSELNCKDKDEHGFEGEQIIMNMTEGENVVIRVASIVGKYGAEVGTSCLSAQWRESLPAEASHDVLSDALPIEVSNECVSISNERALMSSDFVPEENSLARADVWLSFDCLESGDYMIETNTDFSESIEVFEVDNGDLQAMDSNHFGQSVSLTNALEGRLYAIQISGLFATIEGAACVKISMVEGQMIEADDCIDAAFVELDEQIDINNELNTFSGIHPSCNVYSGKDRWLKFQSEGTSLFIGTETDFSASFAVYSGQCDDLEEIWCSDNITICEGYLEVIGLQPDKEYLIQIVSDYTFDELKGGDLAIKLMQSIEDEPEPLGVFVNEICQGGSMAVLEILVSGGSGDYEITGHQSGDELFAGEEYLVVVNDTNGCEISKSGVVGCQPSSCDLMTNVMIGNLQCYNGQDGYIFIEIENAVEPVTYQWSDETILGQNPIYMNAGQYTVTITDADQCVLIEEYTLTQPDELVVAFDITDESAQGANDGSIAAYVSGGVFPYSFAWNTQSNEDEITDLIPDNYSITITDALGCTEVSELTVSAFDCNFDIFVSISEATCFDSEDGVIELTSASGLEIQSISWASGDIGANLVDLSQGEYTATITLDNGCESIETYTVEGPNEMILTEESNESAKCFGEANGAVSLSVVGGTGDKTFIWPDGEEGSSRTDLLAGVYEISVIDDNQCIKVFNIEIYQPEILEIASSMGTPPSCHDSQDGMICVFVNGGVQPYDFDWGDAQPAMSKLENLSGGTYSLVVYDLNNCEISTEVELATPEQIAVTIVSILLDESNPDQAAIDIDVEGGSGGYSFSWLFDDVIVSTEEDPHGIEHGVYTLVVTDSNGCEHETELLVDPTSLNELSGLSIEVYPNPATDFTEIIVDDIDLNNLFYRVYSTDGKLMVPMKRIQNSRVKIDLEAYLSGAYIVEVIHDHSIKTLPFVKVD